MSDQALRPVSDPPGRFGWLVPRDHRRLALLFLGVLLLCLVVGGGFGLAMRAELLTPEPDLMSATTYNQAFSLHGLLLALVFVLPAIPATLGTFVLPLQLGAHALAFPRLGVASLYLFLAGAGHLVVFGLREPDFMPGSPHWTGLLGATGLTLSAGLTALNLVVTVHRRRAPDVTWGQLPAFVWASYAGAFAVLGSTLLLLGLGVALAVRDPNMLGLLGSPAFAVIPKLALVPALGVVCEILGVDERGRSSRRLVAGALVTLALVALPLWTLHEQAAYVGHQIGRVAVLLLLLVWLRPRLDGGPRSATPRLYAAAAVTLLVLAGLSGSVLRSLADDVALHDTYFIVGDFHMRMQIVVLALLGGLHRWWTTCTGSTYSETAGRIGAVLIGAGMTTQALAELALGHNGMPRRYYTYLPEYTGLHRIATLGAFLVAAGLVWTAIYLARAWSRRG